MNEKKAKALRRDLRIALGAERDKRVIVADRLVFRERKYKSLRQVIKELPSPELDANGNPMTVKVRFHVIGLDRECPRAVYRSMKRLAA